MKTKRRRLPLYRWDIFLLAVVLGFSLIAAVFERLAIPVLTPIAMILLIAIAASAGAMIIVPLFVRSLRRDGEGSFRLGETRELIALDTDDVLPVVDSQRFQGSIEAARAQGDNPFTAVLVPRTTAWLGRDYRVAVDLIVGRRVYRAGYLPREIDQRADAVLAPLAEQGRYGTVQASIRTPSRPYSLRVAVGPWLTQA